MKRWATFLLLISGACCTKMDCPCDDKVSIDFTLDPASNFTSRELQGFYLITTNKEFAPIDSFQFNFPNNIPQLDREHNFLVKNRVTGKIDTIKDIAYTPVDSTFECNECFLRKDIQHCKQLTSKQLTQNGKKVNGFSVVIEK